MKINFFLPVCFLLSFTVVAQQKEYKGTNPPPLPPSTNTEAMTDTGKIAIGNKLTRDSFPKNTSDTSGTLVVFFKPGCSRCTSFRQLLHDKGIAYTEIDMSSDNPAITQMWSDLQKQGFNGGTLHWPLIKKDGHLYWNIIDMNAFVEDLHH